MAAIRKEANVFPDDLFQRDAGSWWVCKTRARAEKKLARLLKSADVAFFLPLYVKQYRVQRRTVTSWLALFPGYVFCRGSREDRTRALMTNEVVMQLESPDQERLDRELREVHRILAAELPLMPEERLLPGQPVEIIDGPLTGLRGTMVRDGGRARLMIAVDFVHAGASIEVDTTAVRAI